MRSNKSLLRTVPPLNILGDISSSIPKEAGFQWRSTLKCHDTNTDFHGNSLLHRWSLEDPSDGGWASPCTTATIQWAASGSRAAPQSLMLARTTVWKAYICCAALCLAHDLLQLFKAWRDEVTVCAGHLKPGEQKYNERSCTRTDLPGFLFKTAYFLKWRLCWYIYFPQGENHMDKMEINTIEIIQDGKSLIFKL